MSVTSGDSTPWVFDSGATHHMSFDHSVLTNCSLVSNTTYIYTANSSPLAVTRSLLLFILVPKYYWAEVILTAALVINITPSSIVAALSPYTYLHCHSFNYSLLYTFGCVCFVDCCSRYTCVYLMQNRYELLQIYTEFTNMIYT